MARLTSRGKRLLAGAIVLVMGITGYEIYDLSTRDYEPEGVVVEQAAPEEPTIEYVMAREIQVEPILTRNENCYFNRDTVLYLSDDIISGEVTGVKVGDKCYRLFSTNTNYSLVRCGKYIGYVDSDALDVASVNTNDKTKYTEFNGLGLVTGTEVNFRIGPGTDFNKCGLLNLHDGITLLAQCNNGWVLARRTDVLGNTKIGFIRGDYAQAVSEEEYVNGIPTFKYGVVSLASDAVIIRREPNKNAESLGRLEHRKVLPYISTAENGWYMVQMPDGTYGYVSNQYSAPSYIVGNMETYKTVGLKSDADLYAAPNGKSVVGHLPMYEIGLVYREDNGYYLIKTYDGQVAYVNKDATVSMSNVCVISDLSDRRTYVINRGNVTFATRMINGKKGSESNTGFGVLASLETNTTIGDPPHDIKLKARIGWTPDPDDSDHYYRNGQCFHDYPGTNFDGINVSGGCFRIEDPIGFYNEVKEAYKEGPVRVLSKQ